MASNASASGLRQAEVLASFLAIRGANNQTDTGDQRFNVGIAVQTGGGAESRIGLSGTLRPAANGRSMTVTQARALTFLPSACVASAKFIFAPQDTWCRWELSTPVTGSRKRRCFKTQSSESLGPCRRRCTQTTPRRAERQLSWTSAAIYRCRPVASSSMASPCAFSWITRSLRCE